MDGEIAPVLFGRAGPFVTLGMLFVWQGLAILLLPKPGGKPPDWLHGLMNFHTPYVPFPIIAAIVIAALVHIGLMRTSYGAILRGSGGNPNAIARAGWSLLKTKVVMFALAGIFGVFSGLSLIGLTTSADANIGKGYTLLSIAGVILGVVNPVGGEAMKPLGDGFIKLIRMMIAPVVFFTVVVGISSIGDLKKLGPAVEGDLRKAAADGRSSPEVRKRVQQLLDSWEKRPASPEELRQLRAMQVLERIANAEARAVVHRLAQGPPGSWLTEQAALAMKRLKDRS